MYLHNRVLYSNENQWPGITCINLDESHKDNSDWKLQKDIHIKIPLYET